MKMKMKVSETIKYSFEAQLLWTANNCQTCNSQWDDKYCTWNFLTVPLGRLIRLGYCASCDSLFVIN